MESNFTGQPSSGETKLLMVAGTNKKIHTLVQVKQHGENNRQTSVPIAKGRGHIAVCTKPKRKRDETWFNDKVLLVQAQGKANACPASVPMDKKRYILVMSTTTLDYIENHDIEVAHMGNDPYFGILIPEVTSDQSSSSDVIHTIVPSDHQVSEHNHKWTKDHPLENIIGDLGRPVSTRLQIHNKPYSATNDALLTTVELINYKDTLTQASWIEAMQKRNFYDLNVLSWELVSSSR
ncbi:hypothetical protein Tco_0070961 [Tanacetum coccineum]